MNTQHVIQLSFLFLFSWLTASYATSEQLEHLNDWIQPYHTRSYQESKGINVPPLFKNFPALKTKIPYLPLGNLPTPIKHLAVLGKHLNAPHLYLKNDSPSGNLYGGNKVRKLEFLLADALYNGATTVVTVGAAGSNHSLATAAYANKLGLSCLSFLVPQKNTLYLQRNLLMTKYYNGALYYYPTGDTRDQAVISNFLTRTQTDGRPPYFIPSGGSCPLGALGFVNAAFELKEQIMQGLIPEPDYIYITLASAGSASGLALGLKLAGLKSKLMPVSIGGAPEIREKNFFNLITNTSLLLSSLDASCPHISLNAHDVVVNHNFISKTYAEITPESADAIKLLHTTETIKVDGTYAGKALAALIHDITNTPIKDTVILFWDTFCEGSFSEIVSTVDYKELPQALHSYFETPVQQLDQGV